LIGLSASYWQLLLMRIGVGAAESGGTPAALSIISDIYPPERRATVSSIFYAGTGIGLVISYLCGGAIAAAFGWRGVFLAFGVPGVVLAIIIFLTVREPARRAPPEQAKAGGGLKAVVADAVGLLFHPVLGFVFAGAAFYTLATAGVGAWTMSFLMRTRHMEVAAAGAILGFAFGMVVLGQILVGVLADAANRRRAGGALVVVAGAALMTLIFGCGFVLLQPTPLVVLCLCGYGAFSSAHAGTVNAVIATYAPPGARGLGFAMYAVVSNLVGSSFGPVFVGLVSDLVGHENGLRQGMLMVLSIQVLTAIVLLLGARQGARAVSSYANP
jgi:MFS family permease